MEWRKEDVDIYTKDGTVDLHIRPVRPVIRKETGKWKACLFILGTEFCERLAYYGVNNNLVSYLEKKFNQGTSTVSNNVTNWAGTCYITPLIGGFLADAYLGRYWTIVSFSTIYVAGMALLTLSASVKGLKPDCHKDACYPKNYERVVFHIAMYLIALGTGGIKPCVSSFGADQFDETDRLEKKLKSSFFNWFYLSINVELKSSFFNWFYLSINMGTLIAGSVLPWIQTNVGWGLGFGVPAVAMAIAVVSFFSGTRLYRHQKPGGSPLTRIAQVITASCKKYKVKVPANESLLYENTDGESLIQGSRKLEHTKQFRFLDKAAVVAETDNIEEKVDPWRLCTVTQVEELKSIVRLFPVWASGIMFATVYSQMSTVFVLQGMGMNASMGPHFRIPSACLSIFDTLAVIFWVPVYDRIIVPFARRYTGHDRGFTELQRMGIGLVISIFSMLAAAIVEVVRLGMVRRHGYYGKDHIPISIFWQIPQYFIVGAAEVFTFIGQLEFFYAQAPEAMRSLCSAMSLTTVALGNYLSTVLVTIVRHVTTKDGKPGWLPRNLNYGHLDYFYWLLAILSLLNFFIFVGISRWYTYKRPTGAVHG